MPSRILRLWNPDASAWEEVGDSRLSTHLAAADPHPVYLQETLADAKGDLLAASAADTLGRLALGTNGHVLTADSTQALGVKWAAAAAGGMADPTTAKGDLIVRGTGVALKRLNPGLSGTRTDTGLTFGSTFTASGDGYVTELRVYRTSLSTTHYGLTLWDRTTSGVVAGSTNTAEWAGYGSVGWATYTLPSPLAVVAGRQYTVTTTYTGQWTQTSGSGSVDSPLAFVAANYANGSSTTPTYPGNSTGTGGTQQGLGVDVGYTATLSTTPTSRLPVGGDGQVLTADAAQTLGVRWATQPAYLTQAVADPLYLSPTEGDAAYLKLTGGTLSGNLGVGVAPAGWWADARAIQVGAAGSLWGGAFVSTTEVGDNTRYDGTNRVAMLTPAAPASFVRQAGGVTTVQAAPSVAAGASQTFTTRLTVAQDGTTTVAGNVVPATAAGASLGSATLPWAGITWRTGALHDNAGGSNARITSTLASLELSAANSYITPTAASAANLGHSAVPFNVVYATNGTIQPSLASVKEDITPLAPEDALAAVRATDPVLFDYRPPERGAEWYELPDDPEQAAQVLEQRMRASPLEEAARHQAGFVLSSPDFATDPLFETGEGQSNAANTAGILLAAIKNLDQRLQSLEGA